MPDKVRVFLYRSKCIGCGACVEADKERWRMSRRDGKCNLIGGREKKGIYLLVTDEGELEALKKAETNCPAKIIKVVTS